MTAGLRQEESDQARLRRPERFFDGYALDLDGTVYLGDALLPGAAETVARIRAAGSRLVFLTNNPLRPAASYAEQLSGLGIPAAEADVVTPLGVLTAYLSGRHPGAAVLTVAEPLVDQTPTLDKVAPTISNISAINPVRRDMSALSCSWF
jgi:ribonucleotide monophosphatase NagD (HAD superfamily)